MSLGNALGYLTLLPVPPKKSIPLLRSVHYFPMVGAAMGSLAVLFFLLTTRYFNLPNTVGCLLTVAFLEFLYGGAPLRDLVGMARGHRTYAGHGFTPDFPLRASGFLMVTAMLALKILSLAALPSEWQTHAVFMLPMIGRCSQTLSFVLSPQEIHKSFRRDRLIAQRRVRAGLWSLILLLLFFLFPLRVAFPALGLFALIQFVGLRRCNSYFKGLTLQTVSLLSETSEVALLVMLAIAAYWVGLK